MSADAFTPTSVVFLCDGAPAVLPEDLEQAPDIRVIWSHGTESDLAIEIEPLYRLVLQEVRGRHADFVRLAAFVYRADLAIGRGSLIDAHAEKWRRRLHLCVAVDDPGFWNQDAVRNALTATLDFLTSDHWTFYFSVRHGGGGDIHAHYLDLQPFAGTGVVTLFSGGLDSLCVLVDAATRGEAPLALGHWPSSRHEHRQRQLLEVLRQARPHWPIPLIGVRLMRHGEGTKEQTQRSRGFLFAALAAAVAAEIGAPKVYLADNGPISLNLPINDQLVGAMVSRATHPRTIANLQQVIDLVVSHPVAIANPLQWTTRRETLHILEQAHLEHLIAETNSCSNTSRLSAATPQCGGCSQCIDRRFAVTAAGLTAYDPPGRYARDVFTEPLATAIQQMTAISYARFARTVRQLTVDELLLDYPQLLDVVVPGDGSGVATIQTAVDMMQRHATTVMDVLEETLRQHVAEVVAGTIPAGSLLGHLVGEQRGRRGPETTVRFVPQPDLVILDGPSHGRRIELGEGHPAPDLPERPGCVWTGAGWKLTYAGKEAFAQPSVNLTRIAVLLREPGRFFTPEELSFAVNGIPPAPLIRQTPDGLAIEQVAPRDPVVDRETIRSVRANLEELRQDRVAAEAVGAVDRIAEIDRAIAFATDYLRGSTGLDGKARTFPTTGSKHRVAILRSLDRGISAIRDVHQSLGVHLDQALVRTSVIAYAPEPLLRWQVQLPTQAA